MKLSDCSGSDCALIAAGCFETEMRVVISKASVKDGVMDNFFFWGGGGCARSQNCLTLKTLN